jgi:hypothetical protein
MSESLPSLARQVLAIDHALRRVPHAFGGALSLAYYAEPRATIDIDLNVFVPAADAERVLGPLRVLGADVTAADLQRIDHDGQGRVRWQGTPVDLFFAYDPFHDAAAAATRRVPFADAEIPILSAEHLIVCKVVFNRSKDWVDIEAMIAAATGIDVAEVLRWVGRIAGDEDPRYERIVALLST